MLDKRLMSPERRKLLGAFAGIATVAAAPVYSGVFGFLKGAGDIRQLKMQAQRSGEQINIVYWIDGKYVKPALQEISNLMRDWRNDEVMNMDVNNIDNIAAVQNLLETNEPFMLLSGYRTPATNRMLASKSRRVAKDSYHTKGMAADLRLQSRSMTKVAAAAQAVAGGGVGRYYRSNFTHIDCGPIRTWRS
ncbi:MAG: DUF882 domain-containing protein [Pseudomonadota bacterium]